MAIDLLEKNIINSSYIISKVEELSDGVEVFNELISGNEKIIKAVLINTVLLITNVERAEV